MPETPNPYENLAPEATESAEDRNARKALWFAYAFSPVVAPIAFVVLFLAVAFGAVMLGFEVNPPSILILPVVAMTFGTVVCYLVAGLIGMPMAFYLHRRRALNALTIHVSALAWSVFVATLVGTTVAVANGAQWQQILAASAGLTLLIAPPVLLSATSFWVIAKRNGALSPAESDPRIS